MYQARRMRVVERLGHLSHQLRGLPICQPADSKQLLKRDAFDKIRHDGRQPVEFGDLMNGDDARMAQLGRRPRFAAEPFQTHFGRRQALVRDLQGHHAMQIGVARLPHGTKCPRSNALKQAKTAELTYLGVGSRLWVLDPERTPAVTANDLVRLMTRCRNRIVAVRTAQAPTGGGTGLIDLTGLGS